MRILAPGLEIGSIVEGTVRRIADYGAIVSLPGGKTGLIHISKISDGFVCDVYYLLRSSRHSVL